MNRATREVKVPLLFLLGGTGCGKRATDCRALSVAIATARSDAGTNADGGTAPALRALTLTDPKVSSLRSRYVDLFDRAGSGLSELDATGRDLGRRNVTAAALRALTDDEASLVKEINGDCSK